MPSQTAAKSAGTISICSDKPVLKEPYSAKSRFTSVTKLADGEVKRIESDGSEARDSAGRTYNAGERNWTYFDGKKSILKSEMLYRIEDPVGDTETRWDTTSKIAKRIHWAQSAPSQGSQTGRSAVCDESTTEFSGESVEKLGRKTISGCLAEGTRSSYTVPMGQDHNNRPIVVAHETWYCPELKIVVIETNDDPRSGTTRNELLDVVRGEPDAARYRPPADYVLHEIQFP